MQSLWRGDSAGRTLATAEYRCGLVHPLAARAGSSQTPWSHHRSAIPGQAVRHVEGNAVGCRPGMPDPVLSLPWCAQAEPKTDAKELSQASQDKGETRGSHARWGSSCPSLRSTPTLGEYTYIGMCVWGMCMGYRDGNRVHCRNVKQRRWTDIPSLGWCKGVMEVTAMYLKRDGGPLQKAQCEWCLLWERPLEGDGRAGLCFSDQAKTPSSSRVLASFSPHSQVGQGYCKPCLILLPSTCCNTIVLFFMPTWSMWMHPFPFPVILSHELRTDTFQKSPSCAFPSLQRGFCWKHPVAHF